jgi:uncharacterized phiE125 gp8 family phage protein
MLSLVVPAEEWPVSLEEAKAHLHVTFDDDDAMIDIYRKAAAESAEHFTGLAFYSQVWDYYVDSFPPSATYFEIPKSPILNVEAVFYDDGSGEQEWATDGYRVDNTSRFPRLSLAYGSTWPSAVSVTNAVRVRFTAGMVDDNESPVVGAVPWLIKAAILLTTGTLYQNREDVVVGTIVTKMPQAARDLLRDFRIHTAIG